MWSEPLELSHSDDPPERNKTSVLTPKKVAHINSLLLALHAAPFLEGSSGGETVLVTLGDDKFDICDVTQAISDSTLEHMISQNVDVDWLLAKNSGQVNKLDFDPLLLHSQAKLWQTACDINATCERELGLESPVPDGLRQAQEMVCVALVATYQAIERAYPRNISSVADPSKSVSP